MPRYHWTPDMVTTAIACIADGGTYSDAATAVDLTHHAVAGLVYRLRASGDPRLPESLRIKTPGRQPRHGGARVTSTDGSPHERVAHLAAIDERNLDRRRRSAASDGSAQLLRAQLRAGQHLLGIPLARAVAERMGMDPRRVRPGIGDATKEAHHHAR